MQAKKQQLTTLRQQIDAIDQQILQLINQRAAIAIQVGQAKRDAGILNDFYRPEREAQILSSLLEKNPGPLSVAQTTTIFRALLTACLSLQQPLKVAYLGPAGTYSQAAVYQHFGVDTTTLPVVQISQVFREVEAEHAHYGVVPIENSTNGIVTATLDALIQASVHICGEVVINIEHHLLSKSADSNSIKRVYAHEQALAQCRHWLAQNLPSCELIAVSSNGAAAQLAATETDAAAIAGDLAAEYYQLQKIHSNIQDNPLNKTRFLIVGKQKVAPSGYDKTSLLFSTPHTPGALIDLIQPFADNGVNLSLIESRPYRSRDWSYVFFIDIDGHREDQPVKQALDCLMAKSIMLTVLGSYPKARG